MSPGGPSRPVAPCSRFSQSYAHIVAMGTSSFAGIVVCVAACGLLQGALAAPSRQPAAPGDVEVPVKCIKLADDGDEVLCRTVHRENFEETANAEDSESPEVPVHPPDIGELRRARGLLHCRKFCAGKVGFLAGLHLGGAISSSGSLSASHSLNVFGKVMNTALSVSYGPNGLYQGPGLVRPPLSPILPVLGDDPNAAAPSTSPSPDKGHEAAAVQAGTLTKDGGISARVEAAQEAPARKTAVAAGGAQDGERHQNRLPVAEDIGTETAAKEKGGGEAPSKDENRLDHPLPPIRADVDEEVIGEEPEPPAVPAGQGMQLSAQSRAQLEAVARLRTPSTDEQRRLFLEHHNKHVATFNRHHAKYNGDVSRVALFSRS